MSDKLWTIEGGRFGFSIETSSDDEEHPDALQVGLPHSCDRWSIAPHGGHDKRARAGRLGGSAGGGRKRRGERNGKWLGAVDCTACAAPADYKRAALCRRCYDRVRHLGYAIGPADLAQMWWIRLGRPVVCVVPSCNRGHKGRGLCALHLARERRNSHPLWMNKGHRSLIDKGDVWTSSDTVRL